MVMAGRSIGLSWQLGSGLLPDRRNPMDLYLIRHSQSLNNARSHAQRVEDPSLSKLGREQGGYLARHVVALGLTRMVVSPFLRTLQTAELLRPATGLAPHVAVLLHEVGGCMWGPSPSEMVGRPGLTRSAIKSGFPGYEIDSGIDERGWWQSRPYETREQAMVRTRELLDWTYQCFADTTERVAYVMHGDIERLFLECLGVTVSTVPFNASVTRLQLASKLLNLEDFNDVRHLPPELLTV